MSLLNTVIVKVAQMLPKSMVRVFAGKYIAGEELQDAINLVKQLNSKGIFATLDVLGESIKNKEEAIEAKKKCIEVIEAIETNKLMANLSIKPTQMGLAIDEEFAFQQILEIVQKAKSFDNFVRIDMEDSPFTDPTLRVYKKLNEKIGHVGVVLQA